jgi:hypothetical protein
MPTQKLNLRRKLEKVCLAFLKANAGKQLKNLTRLEGHENVEPDLPYLVCYVSDAKPHDDLPPECGVKTCSIVFHLKTSANDEERAKADARMSELEDTILAPLDDSAPISDENKLGGSFLSFANKPESGDDTRAITGIHVYDFFPADDLDSMDGEQWHDQLVLTATAQDFDSH